MQRLDVIASKSNKASFIEKKILHGRCSSPQINLPLEASISQLTKG
jgi:hypothetical protein